MQEEQKPRRKGSGGNHKTWAPPGYYTLAQAVAVVGMPKSTFQSHVGPGKIVERYVPPIGEGMQKPVGYYPIKQVKKLAALYAASKAVSDQAEKTMQTALKDVIETEVRVALGEDEEGVFQVLVALGWDKKAATPDQRREWLSINPHVDFIVTALIDGNREVGGYIHAGFYLPEILLDMMEGRKRARDIQAEHILEPLPGTYDVYIGIATRKDFPQHQNHFGARLITGFLQYIRELAAQGIHIRMLYAVSSEPDGRKLCKRLGFEVYGAGIFLDEPDHDPFIKYRLDLVTSDAPFAQLYREPLLEK